MNNIKLFNNKVEIDPLAVFFVTLITLIDKTRTVPLFILSALLHESGHILAILICKGTVTRIVFEPFSLTLERPDTDTSIKKDIIISVSGILTNFLLLLLSFFVFKHLNYDIFMIFAMTNLIIGAYNLLPLSYLDGGELIAHAEKLIFRERAKGIIPRIFHILTVMLGIIVAGVMLFKRAYLTALLCLYPMLLTPLKRRSRK